MSVQFKVDDKEFQATLRKYLAVSSRTLPEALNQKMFFIVRGAVTRLPKVDKSKIETDLQVSGYELAYQKKRGPAKKKVSLKRELKRAAKSARRQLRGDVKQFRKDARKFGRSASKISRNLSRRAVKSTKRFGKGLRRKLRKAFR